jgi:hypothetical protein
MDIHALKRLSKINTPCPENDRSWIFQKMKSRAEEGYTNIEIYRFEDMPGGGDFDRFEAVLDVLKSEGFEVVKSNGFSGSFTKISWE